MKHPKIPAMTFVMLLLALSALTGLLMVLVHDLRLDGYGRRPGPPSRR